MIDSTLKIKQQKARKRKEALLALLLMSPFLVVFLVFTVIPFIMGFVFSFMSYNPYLPEGNKFIAFDNYLIILDFNHPISKTFWESFLTMFLFDAVAVPLLIVIPLVFAYFINMHPPGYKLFRAIVYLPSIVSVTIVGIIFGNMFKGDETGLINALFGVKVEWLAGKPWQGDTLRWVVMLIASIWWQTGTNFVIFSGALRDVPKSLYEACEMDGGNRFQRIVNVTLPNIRPAINVCLFNTLIGYLNLYAQPYVLNTYENENIFVAPMMFIQKYLMGGIAYAKQTGYLCAAAIIFGLIVLVFSVIERKVTAPRRKKTRYTQMCRSFVKNTAALDGAGVNAAILTEEVRDD